MPDLSVIVPIYNTPTQALRSCIESLAALAGICWEAVLVDDGSEPPIGALCRQYAQADARIRYVRKDNGGVSSARNMGLDHARGRYVMFADADDVLLCDPIVRALHDAHEDIILFDIELEENGAVRTWHALPGAGGPVSAQQLLDSLIRCNDLNSPCAKLLRRELLEAHRVRFQTQFITGEDWLFVTDAVLHAQSVRYIKAPCYRYLFTHSTGNTRLMRFPDQVLSNCIARYDRKLQLLELLPPEGRQAPAAAAAALLTETLFNTASELLLAKLLTPQREKTIRDTVAALHVYAHLMPRKSRIKASILLRFPLALRLAATARKAYLAMK